LARHIRLIHIPVRQIVYHFDLVEAQSIPLATMRLTTIAALAPVAALAQNTTLLTDLNTISQYWGKYIFVGFLVLAKLLKDKSQPIRIIPNLTLASRTSAYQMDVRLSKSTLFRDMLSAFRPPLSTMV